MPMSEVEADIDRMARMVIEKGYDYVADLEGLRIKCDGTFDNRGTTEKKVTLRI